MWKNSHLNHITANLQWFDIDTRFLFLYYVLNCAHAVAPNSLSFCFCLSLSNVTNYKSAALQVWRFVIRQHFRVRRIVIRHAF